MARTTQTTTPHPDLPPERRTARNPQSRLRVGVSLATALLASACTVGPGVPTTPTTPTTSPPGPTTTTTAPTPGNCARDSSLPEPGDVSVDLLITGRVLGADGQPEPDVGGFATVTDRRSGVGAHLSETSVNDAGFFLLSTTSNTIPADLDCRDYWIEICAAPSTGACDFGGDAGLVAELDITGLVNEGVGLGRQRIDISNEPLVYSVVE